MSLLPTRPPPSVYIVWVCVCVCVCACVCVCECVCECVCVGGGLCKDRVPEYRVQAYQLKIATFVHQAFFI